MGPNNLFKLLYLGIVIAAILMTVRQVQEAAYGQAMPVCAYRLYRTLQHERV